MILNLYVTLNYTLVLFYFLVLFTLHESTNTMYSGVNDTLSSLFMNDFFINSYYLLWTSSWYLPTFLIISFSVLLINSVKSGAGYVWLIIGLLFLVVSLHYQNFNVYNYLLDNCSTNFNTLLSNSINKFHPALFYTTLLPSLSVLQLLLADTSNKYLSNFTLSYTRFLHNMLILVIVFTLFLGSWWALQEGSWGGWWNWDPSEVFGLFVMLCYIYTLHNQQITSNHPIIISYLNILTQLVLITYVFIQLNFDLVSHNFGTKVDQFIDTSQNFLVFITYLLFLILITVHRLISNLITATTTSVVRTIHSRSLILVWHIASTFTLSFILLSSFSLLINDFLWNLLTVNVFNSANITYFYTSLLIVLVLLRSWSTQTYAIVLLAYVPYFSNEVLLMAVVPAVTKLNTLHVSILSLLFVMLSESNQSTSFWEILYENISYVYAHEVCELGSPFISLNNFMTECLLNTQTNSNTSESVWNFTWLASSNENHNFCHSITTNTLIQALHAGNGLSNYVINVLDLYITTSNLIIFLLLTITSSLLNTPNLITS